MKLKGNITITQRAAKRFKWTCLACLSVAVVQLALDRGVRSVQEFQFVEAGEDATFEQDELYSGYVDSANAQRELMRQQKREGHRTWTLAHYQKFQAKRLETLLTAAELQRKMESGEAGWEKEVPYKDFDTFASGAGKVAPLDSGNYQFRGEQWKGYKRVMEAQGYIEEYYGEERCFSGLINTPGVSLLSPGLMGVAHFLFLIYLFLGISISADIFMEAIEVITSTTVMEELYDKESERMVYVERNVWNATLANLTLMAFGSSAPEIILSVLEALKDLGHPAGELGPSTIVGSAAFNLLIISAVSVVAVGDPTAEEPAVKKIDDLGVFLTTASFSVFAYIWLYLCLAVNSEAQVTVGEASWTFAFFFILLGLAFCADKYNQRKKAKLTAEERAHDNKMKINKASLRSIARQKGDMAVLSAAQGQQHDNVSENEVQQIRDLYMEILQTNDLSKATLDELATVLRPEALFERFAARKAHGAGATKDFLEVKGQKFQLENAPSAPVRSENDLVGFKCLHYSVSESAGVCTVTVGKKSANRAASFGIRTKDDAATAGKEYDPIDDAVTISANAAEQVVEIKIHDNQEWGPDLNFYVELYDTATGQRLRGDDTECKITILDEDFPGVLGFQVTEVQAGRGQDRVDVTVTRVDGTDGAISCMVRTEAFITDAASPQNAVEFEDYLPKHERVDFASGESERVVQIFLVNERIDKTPVTAKAPVGINDEIDEESEEEEAGPKFKVVLEKPEPDQVKISKKNCCTVELLSKTKKNVKANEEHTKLLAYFIQQRSPTWSGQFLQACVLQPQIDEDDLVVQDVTLYEALTHFATIGWKLLFACIPPVEWGGGWPAFAVALTMIGTITAVVAEVATVLGCTVGLKPAVTAITLVAIGTSLPDTFASMTAARNSEFADAAVGNVTGSNSVNVFVGLGLPWLISALYAQKHNTIYVTPPGTLAFSVMLFLITSLTCFAVLGARRCAFGGELGGPTGAKYVSAFILVTLWLIYVTFSTLKAYDIIAGI